MGERWEGVGEREEDGVGWRVGGWEGGGIIRLLGDCVGEGVENRGIGGWIWGFGVGFGFGLERFRVGMGVLLIFIVVDVLGVDCLLLLLMLLLVLCGCWIMSVGGVC